MPCNEAALARKKPVDSIIASSSARSAAARSAAVGYLAKTNGVTRLTRASVHCAERIVAMSSCNGVSKSSSQCASG